MEEEYGVNKRRRDDSDDDYKFISLWESFLLLVPHTHMYSYSLEYYGLSLLMFRDHKLCFSVCFSLANEGNTACSIYVCMFVCKMAHKGTHCGGCNKA